MSAEDGYKLLQAVTVCAELLERVMARQKYLLNLKHDIPTKKERVIELLESH